MSRFPRSINAANFGIGILARLLLGLWVAFAVGMTAAHADEGASDWFVTQQGRVRLIAAEPTVGAGSTVQLGLQFELAPHWKIYWRSPGDAGFPPDIDWGGSENLAGSVIAWPTPTRFSVLGLETMGYENEIVLPISAHLAAPAAALHLNAALRYLTCENICIPYETMLRLDLPTGSALSGRSALAELIAKYQALVPGDGTAVGLRLENATVTPGAKPVLSLMLAVDPPLTKPDAFIEGPDGVAFGVPTVIADDPRHPVLRLPVFGAGKEPPRIVGARLRVTVVDGARSLDATLTPAETAPSGDLATRFVMVLVALVGGLILNVMPCVLPVLSLKLLSVTGAGAAAAALRRQFLASAAGILASFLALAAVLIALRDAGVAVGWGLQFQQPIFLAAMALVTGLFAANLFGFFEIPLPRWVADRAGIAGGNSKLLGNFAAGVLATLLATPCSAPFVGTAVGFALAGSALDILLIFTALGLGLALPYLAVASVPGMARLLPRPGRWMIGFRRVLGVALLGTTVWLVLVLSAELGTSPLAASRDAFWQPFERDHIAELVGDGKVVFVDVTADWCLTCQLNKRLVLDRSPVREHLDAAGVVAMQADWTRPDPAIAAYLKSYDRYGIPFNAVYGPGAPQGIALSELLTADDVVAAIKRARGADRAPGIASQTPYRGG